MDTSHDHAAGGTTLMDTAARGSGRTATRPRGAVVDRAPDQDAATLDEPDEPGARAGGPSGPGRLGGPGGPTGRGEADEVGDDTGAAGGARNVGASGSTRCVAPADPDVEPVALWDSTDPTHDVISTVVSRSDQVTVERALMAVLALHTPDDRGECPTCAPSGWRRWRSARQRRRGGLRPGSAGAVDCPTRAVLRIAVLDPCADPAPSDSGAG